MKFNHYSTLLLISLLGLLTACSEDIVTVPKSVSSAKAITKLVFSQFNPVVQATIDESTKKITASLPPTADITKLTPAISVSPKAKEIPIGSGNKYLKNGVDGKRTIQGRSSMFPKSWNLDKIIEEVAYVRSRLVLSDRVPDSNGNLNSLYSKACSDGSFNIRMYLNNPADLNNYDVIGGSAFPEVR